MSKFAIKFWGRCSKKGKTSVIVSSLLINVGYPIAIPKTKAQSMQWQHQDEGSPLKARTALSVGKVMITVFWNAKGSF